MLVMKDVAKIMQHFFKSKALFQMYMCFKGPVLQKAGSYIHVLSNLEIRDLNYKGNLTGMFSQIHSNFIFTRTVDQCQEVSFLFCVKSYTVSFSDPVKFI